MAKMRNVPGLEPYHFFPAFFLEEIPCLLGLHRIFEIRGFRFVYKAYLSAKQRVLHGVSLCHTRMGGIVCPIYLLCECSFIVTIDFFNLHHSYEICVIFEENFISFLYIFVIGVKNNRKSPWKAVGEALVVEYALVIFPAVETFKRAEKPGSDIFNILHQVNADRHALVLRSLLRDLFAFLFG